MRSLLSRWGCDVRTATAIKQSFVEISKQKPDLLLVDFQLGEVMTGVELIQAIRKRLGDDIPAVLVTAEKQPELRQQCLERDITFLGKPVKPAAMRAVLNLYRARIHGSSNAPSSNPLSSNPLSSNQQC